MNTHKKILKLLEEISRPFDHDIAIDIEASIKKEWDEECKRLGIDNSSLKGSVNDEL